VDAQKEVNAVRRALAEAQVAANEADLALQADPDNPALQIAAGDAIESMVAAEEALDLVEANLEDAGGEADEAEFDAEASTYDYYDAYVDGGENTNGTMPMTEAELRLQEALLRMFRANSKLSLSS
jgi:hypothetical protein